MTITPADPAVGDAAIPVDAAPAVPAAPHTGLLVLAAPDCALRALPACQDLGGWPGRGLVLLLLRTRRLLADADHVRQVPLVHAVTAVPAGPVTIDARLALAYAHRLRQHRTTRRSSGSYLLGGAAVTGVEPLVHDTARPPQMTLVPHLATLTSPRGTREAVVREWMWRPAAQHHLGVPTLPAPEALRPLLPGLLRLRHASRHRRLPATDAGNELAQILHDRVLTSRDIYQHTALIRRLLLRGHRDDAS
ncbi:hypothetical protein LX15_001149 [Streptoalloteichus tenebrarius]|uniref:Uncharacterized protein n=1 Tax=Streptoalloteichus tenebrarius (strain ATCC 17920 / DSM 40477 / JCM 4838 / CBS 697.72 / NBRC 16177 / NCIMB 11028 / NRRL B-12390 / A12253. 1 / ISP 5477) TaxID=1933 RepID=A0ABT1HPM3_STRSD|nr:hypothetical protein [Streptoalloteichus tenebrarius]MCP2257464.1 hypothetical protein [Streptoalloteichus tenebrarius]BFE98412.1 hypothetical protein GCM10020241_00880 [Streptoalloteichus tenebrarius]